ncbi:MAG: nitroreductase family protein, partial [Pseudomonadota bacterium]
MTRFPSSSPSLSYLLAQRFSDAPDVEPLPGHDLLRSMAGRGSCRAFRETPVSDETLEMLSAVALSSPTKSDLQQRDIVVLKSAQKRAQLAELVSGQAWVAQAPVLLVFCGNNRRQRLLHSWTGIPFANDHLDAFANALADAAIALAAFVTAAEALGLGCCPISAVRNEAAQVSHLLGLPDHVFPFAGLALGHPAASPEMSMRLPLKVTYHVDHYGEEGLRPAVEVYDAARASRQPYKTQRFEEHFG